MVFSLALFPAVPEHSRQPAVRERSSRGTGANFAVPLAECPCPTGKQIRGENAKGVEPFAQVRCPKTRKRVRGSQEKRPFSNGFFSIQSEGLACNHDAVVYVIAVGVWHHASACIFLRIDSMHHFVMIPSKAYALIPYTPSA